MVGGTRDSALTRNSGSRQETAGKKAVRISLQKGALLPPEAFLRFPPFFLIPVRDG